VWKVPYSRFACFPFLVSASLLLEVVNVAACVGDAPSSVPSVPRGDSGIDAGVADSAPETKDAGLQCRDGTFQKLEKFMPFGETYQGGQAEWLSAWLAPESNEVFASLRTPGDGGGPAYNLVRGSKVATGFTMESLPLPLGIPVGNATSSANGNVLLFATSDAVKYTMMFSQRSAEGKFSKPVSVQENTDPGALRGNNVYYTITLGFRSKGIALGTFDAAQTKLSFVRTLDELNGPIQDGSGYSRFATNARVSADERTLYFTSIAYQDATTSAQQGRRLSYVATRENTLPQTPFSNIHRLATLSGTAFDMLSADGYESVVTTSDDGCEVWVVAGTSMPNGGYEPYRAVHP
jgi:hypothetical protein